MARCYSMGSQLLCPETVLQYGNLEQIECFYGIKNNGNLSQCGAIKDYTPHDCYLFYVNERLYISVGSSAEILTSEKFNPDKHVLNKGLFESKSVDGTIRCKKHSYPLHKTVKYLSQNLTINRVNLSTALEWFWSL